jgi:type IV pilus assembly protein PilB
MTDTAARNNARRHSLPALDLMVEAGHLSVSQAGAILGQAARTGHPVAQVVREVNPQLRVPAGLDLQFVDLFECDIDLSAVNSVPEALARRHAVLPIHFDGERLVVAIADPSNVIAIDDLRTVTGRDLKLVLAESAAIDDIWTRMSGFDRSAEALLEEALPEEEEEDVLEHHSAEDAPIVRAINQIIAQAVNQRASDLHIEPQERDVRVRFRLDGVLHEAMRVPRSLHAGITSRIKIMAELDIAERRIPQDGRMTVVVAGNSIDLRVTTVPSVWGEEVILRILDRSSSLLGLVELGFLEQDLERFEQAFRKPYGAILVVGPTGSGKSTTLYSTLSVVNEVARKIITVEDPVEFRLPGVSQIHVNNKIGMTFAKALRSILRSDPDVLMVGEIRDTETARIAIEAAMTGHLVLSTLHTNDAPSALTRLIEIGVEPFLVASALECVLAQRLIRKLCLRCREEYIPPPEVASEVGLPEGLPLYRPIGCNHCSGTGYRGRLALFELMTVTEEIELMAVERRSSDDIRRLALSQGMRTLREDGFEKVRNGVTSLEEVLRIVEGTGKPAHSPDVDGDADPLDGPIHAAG